MMKTFIFSEIYLFRHQNPKNIIFFLKKWRPPGAGAPGHMPHNVEKKEKLIFILEQNDSKEKKNAKI